ncbi:MAG: hypothetical protein AUK48_11485 [Oscillatoriales cyanobacterium CG2_30_44_21]|nr:MAG: hypothetical protein AUK48_11485 [Oscillatoriales cyanobacterium CG2_30_44_21]
MYSKSPDNLSFNPLDLLQNLLAKNYDLVSQQFIEILEHFDQNTYLELPNDSRYFVNAFVKNFLYIFTQSDYLISDRYVERLIQFNLTISNLVAISDFKSTDPYLEILKNQPQNFAKILTLCSARNSFKFQRRDFFNASPALANLWYSCYLEIYRTGLVNRIVYQNLREHLVYEDERLTDFYKIDDLYFGATYIDGDSDRFLKSKINQSIQNSNLIKNLVIYNQPNPRKVAIISGLWLPAHSVYRILSDCIASLKDDYELTLIHLGDRQLEIDQQHFQDVKYLQFQNNQLDISSIQNNDFNVVYFPDIGMSAQSILLSNLRIAPIQICGLGHPVSTFGSEIDYFISGADAEVTRNAEVNYSERLVLLNGLGAVNNHPNYQSKQSLDIKTLRDATDGKSQFIINCPWYAQKVNYPLLILLKKIVQDSKRPILFRFFSGGGLIRKNDFLPFVHEVTQVLGVENVKVYPYLPYQEYMTIMEEGDICLDSYHFGGFNVIIDSLFLQKPTVVFEGKRWYSRAGARLIKKIGLGDLVAKNPTEYTQLSLKLINNHDFLWEMQERVRQIDLNGLVFQSTNSQYFKKAIDFLIQNHEYLRGDRSRKPIRIS